jgi:signal transduction histidine kinase
VELKFNFPVEAGSITLQCRAVEVSQVLVNLLNNAYDAIEGFSQKWIEIKVEESNESVILKVIDCGSGVNPEISDKILKPFFTTKAAGKGTGLGLSISQRIVEAHRGQFTIDTNAKNTTFVVELPKKQPNAITRTNFSFKRPEN